MKPHRDPDDGPVTGWCESCEEPCATRDVDYGFAYGDRGHTEDWQLESACCGANVLNYDPKPEEVTDE